MLITKKPDYGTKTILLLLFNSSPSNFGHNRRRNKPFDVVPYKCWTNNLTGIEDLNLPIIDLWLVFDEKITWLYFERDNGDLERYEISNYISMRSELFFDDFIDRMSSYFARYDR